MPSRNASFELEGWDFQINAAIFMVLKDVKNIERVRLEGKLQDIELTKTIKQKYMHKQNLFMDTMMIEMLLKI